MTAIQVGPFIIPVLYLVIAISFGFSLVILCFTLKDQKEQYSSLLNLYVNSVLIMILIWKLSPSILNPMSFIKEPSSLIFQYGTKKHLYIGALFSSAYILLSSKKQGVPIRFLIDSFPFLYVGFRFMYNLLILKPGFYHIPLNFFISMLYLFVFLRLWGERKDIGTLSPTYKFCFDIGIIYLALSFFKEQNIAFGGISFHQAFYIFILSLGLFKPKLINPSS
jgi:hypothetical protein